MKEQQEGSSEPSKSQNTDMPRYQENINMDGKFQETMHMPYNLKLKMAIINGRMLLTWKLNKTKNTKYSKVMEKLFMRKTRLQMPPRDIKRVHFVFNVKHCGKFKARLVADGRHTKEPNETV